MNFGEFNEFDQPDAEHLGSRSERALAWRMLGLSSELSATLGTHPESSSFNEFSFYEDRLANVALPEYVSSATLTRKLDEIQIDVSFQADAPESGITLRFIVIDDDGKKLVIQLDSPHFSGTDYSCHIMSVGEESYDEMRAVPSQEVNQCIASLIYPSDDSNFDQFSDINMRSSLLSPELLSSLDTHSSEYSSEKEYEVTSTDGETKGYIRHCFDGTELYITEITRVIHDDYGVDKDGSLVEDVRKITTEIELGDAKNIGGTSFYIEDNHKSSIEMEALIDDFMLTLSFMEDINLQYKRDDVSLSEIDDNTAHPDIISDYGDEDDTEI